MFEGTHILFIPAVGANLGIAPTSAIIAAIDQAGPGRVLIHFEGNLYDFENLKAYAERVRQAAGRQVDRYPTIAKMQVTSEELIEVGRYDYVADRVVSITSPDLLKHWIPDEATWVDQFSS